MEVMHDPARLIAVVTFSAAMAGTPGPSNALLTAVGARGGVRRGLASLLGQVTGMGAMLFAITLGLGNVLLAHPLALQVLKWSGAAMICAGALCGGGCVACAVAVGFGDDAAGVNADRALGGVADRGHSRGCGQGAGFVVDDRQAGPG